MKKWGPGLLWLILLLPVAVFDGIPQARATRLQLVRRHPLPANAVQVFDELPQRTGFERIREILRHDLVRERARQRAWVSGVGRNASSPPPAPPPPPSGEMPLNSAADYRTGQYLVRLKVGSPAQRLLLVADTGSDLTWMNCKPPRLRRRGNGSCPGFCRRSRSRSARDRPRPRPRPRRRRRRVFRAAASSSFKTVPCLSEFCKVELANLFSLARCPTQLTPCSFDYRYSDGSAALGIFANETVTLDLAGGGKKRLHDVVVGCTRSTRGSSFREAVEDGVLGLGFSRTSFTKRATDRLGGKFSYCLMDHLSPANVSNYLTFGGDPSLLPAGGMRFTRLLLGVLPPYYAVSVGGVSVGDEVLAIPPPVWDAAAGGGAIVDSGSSLTFLTRPAYGPLLAALLPSLRRFRRVDPGIEQLEHCFDGAGFDEALVPRLVIRFADGARFEPAVKNYMIYAGGGVRCLGIVPTAWPGTTVIGNIMQQQHLWEFDLRRRRLGFAPSDCA